jgi:hypothetical protein
MGLLNAQILLTYLAGMNSTTPVTRGRQLGLTSWRGGRVVEGAALEMLFRGNFNEGSNPSLSVLASSLLDLSLKGLIP